MRLIDADELKVHRGINVGANYGGLRTIVFKRDIDNAPTIDAAIVYKRDIDNAPTIDAIEVGRCKDCKYNPQNPRSYYDNDEIYSYAMCGHLNGGEDGFCSNYKPLAERKES